jgi:hypothetical protein
MDTVSKKNMYPYQFSKKGLRKSKVKQKTTGHEHNQTYNRKISLEESPSKAILCKKKARYSKA